MCACARSETTLAVYIVRTAPSTQHSVIDGRKTAIPGQKPRSSHARTHWVGLASANFQERASDCVSASDSHRASSLGTGIDREGKGREKGRGKKEGSIASIGLPSHRTTHAGANQWRWVSFGHPSPYPSDEQGGGNTVCVCFLSSRKNPHSFCVNFLMSANQHVTLVSRRLAAQDTMTDVCRVSCNKA